ncbi:MAG: hypothetical protein RLY66_517 [Candidatus Parcubacteria bacterium]|jgi:hypothetical protein
MSSWSKRRRTLYATVIVVFLVGVVLIPAFLIFYKAPTCSDNKRNGSEQGVDCGGSCERLCQSSFLPPSLAWARFEEVAPKLYNIAAYIVNPNTEGEAINAPYHLALYDSRGVLITDTTGIVTLPPHRNTLAYKGAVAVGERIPAKALFEFTSAPVWRKKVDTLKSLIIGDKKYTEDESGSSLLVTLKNPSVYPIERISVYVILYDKDGNALGFSKTVVDEIPAKGEALAPFTWPIDRKGAVISIEVLPVAE